MEDEMISLYNMSEGLKTLTDLERVGEMDQEEFNDYADILELDIQEKAGCVLSVIRNMEVSQLAISDEVARLNKLKQMRQKNIENLKEYVLYCMNNAGLKRIDTPLGNFSLRKSTSVNIGDETLIPEEYTATKTVTTPDKRKIKDALSKGQQVGGARLSHNNNLQIK